MQNQIDLIKSNISEIGFNNAANIFSISDSAKFGGNIGWIDEKNLSEKLLRKFKKNRYWSTHRYYPNRK